MSCSLPVVSLFMRINDIGLSEFQSLNPRVPVFQIMVTEAGASVSLTSISGLSLALSLICHFWNCVQVVLGLREIISTSTHEKRFDQPLLRNLISIFKTRNSVSVKESHLASGRDDLLKNTKINRVSDRRSVLLSLS